MTNRQAFIHGMTGVYYVAAELSSQGYVVTLTARNAPTVDMMVSTPDLKRTFNVQVKTNGPKGTRQYWLLSEETKQTVSPNLIYAFVNLKESGKPDFYIANSKTVAKLSEKNRNFSGYNFARNEKYKDKWDVLK